MRLSFGLCTRAAAMLVMLAAIAPPPALARQAGDGDGVTLIALRPSGPNGALVLAGLSLGKVLHTADGGQVFGFDLDQRGGDGLLASAQTISPQGQVLASVETFDQTTAKITKVVVTTRTMDDFVTEGIAGHDVGLVLHEHVVQNRVVRSFHILDPVTANRFTGAWTPPNGSDLLIQQLAENQATNRSAILATDLTGNPFLFSSNVAANTFGPAFALDPNHFGGADQPQLAQDVAHDRAVFATSPDGGRVGGQEPLIGTIDLTTGRLRQFNGVVIPPFNSGFVNGLGVDASTGIACTTTELDADVEFYDLARETGFFVGLPGANGDQGFTGEAVAADPVHHLFLIAQPNGSVGPPGDSVIDIFDESGDLVESITGFKAFGVTPGLAIDPAARVGFIAGPTADALTRFTY